MANQPLNYQPGPTPPQPPGSAPPPPKRSWRFRWEWWLGVPLACLLAAWLLKASATPTFDWSDVMRLVHVSQRSFGRYTELCVLGLTLIGVVAVLRVLKKKGGRP